MRLLLIILALTFAASLLAQDAGSKTASAEPRTSSGARLPLFCLLAYTLSRSGMDSTTLSQSVLG